MTSVNNNNINENNNPPTPRNSRFSKYTKTTGLVLSVIALLLVFVALFNSNWQLSLGLKTRADKGEYDDNYGGIYQLGSDDSHDNDDRYGIDNDESESGIPDEDAFLYSIVFLQIS